MVEIKVCDVSGMESVFVILVCKVYVYIYIYFIREERLKVRLCWLSCYVVFFYFCCVKIGVLFLSMINVMIIVVEIVVLISLMDVEYLLLFCFLF